MSRAASTRLTNGTHTTKIVDLGTKPSAASADYALVGAFIFGTQAAALLNVAPLVTLTDNNSGCSGEKYPATQVPTLTHGALVDPGQPHGSFTACPSSGGNMNTATAANTSYTAGNVVNTYLNAGAAGLQTGSCSRTAPSCAVRARPGNVVERVRQRQIPLSGLAADTWRSALRWHGCRVPPHTPADEAQQKVGSGRQRN
jgi:hypothetical protein